MGNKHLFAITSRWTGNTGQGTSAYRSYERSVTISVKNKADIFGSSGTSFNSDKTKHNPEDLFVSAISSCHLLWYLHLCSENGVVVLDYVDNATGTMEETADGGGKFTEVTLHPTITLSSQSMIQKATELHMDANRLCYIANSCNFPIHHQPIFLVHDTTG